MLPSYQATLSLTLDSYLFVTVNAFEFSTSLQLLADKVIVSYILDGPNPNLCYFSHLLQETISYAYGGTPSSTMFL